MSAETLRRAASLIRQRAEAATPGPWASEDYPGAPRTWQVYQDSRVGIGETVGVQMGESDATHIASWHPAIALAVAEVLERRADLIDRDPFRVLIEGIDDDLLAVARAYLGESA